MKFLLFALFLFFLSSPFIFAHETETSHLEPEKSSFLSSNIEYVVPFAFLVLVACLFLYKIIRRLIFVSFAIIFIGVGVYLASDGTSNTVAGFFGKEVQNLEKGVQHLNSPADSYKSIVGDETVIEKVTSLQAIVLERDISLTDISSLYEVLAQDMFARSLFEDMQWLLAKKENDHAEHTLGLLSTYVQTGDAPFCLPHELQHAKVFLEHREYDRADLLITKIQENVPSWIAKQEKAKKEHPQYYTNFDSVKKETIALIDALVAKQYDAKTLSRIDAVAKKGIC